MKKLILQLFLFFLLGLAGTLYAETCMTVYCDSSGDISKPCVHLTDCTGIIEEGKCCWDTDSDTLCYGTGAACQVISAASMTIGGAVSGGTSGSVLYIDSSGNLAQENASFNYDATTNTFTTRVVTTVGDADGPRIILPNAGGPPLVDGACAYDTDVDAPSCSDGTNIYYARPTKLKTCAGNCSPAITELDAMIWVTAAGKVSLPAVAANIYGASVCVYSTTAAAVSVDVNASDRTVLNGTALDDGDSILSASAAGNFICLIVDSANGWTTLGRSGVWTDNGIN